ncbi:MAG: hypothetical protein IAF94_13095, partial [Pirellulaceae bacterium]|nr:hypothetical protein [Pirellulaceae bacterium]
MHFLALDIGSSFIKGAVLDAKKLTIEHVTRVPFPEPVAGLPPGHFEIEPRQVVTAVREVLEKLHSIVSRSSGVLLSSQMGGVILAEPDGAPITNYVSWRDQRSMGKNPSYPGSYLDAIREYLGDHELQLLGNELRAGSALALLFWLEEQGQLPPGSEPLSLGDYVAKQLCGWKRTAPDPTLSLGLLDLSANNWHFHAIEVLGLESLRWPQLDNCWSAAGKARIGGKNLPCYPPIGDHQAALAGALLQSGELSLNISTGSQISLLTDRFAPGNYQMRPYLDGRFLNTVTHLPAGRSLDVLVNLVNRSWPEIVNAADETPDTDLAANLTYFDGPLGSRGSISNITTENFSV